MALPTEPSANALKLRAYRKKNPGKASEWTMAWAKRNPEKVKSYYKKYRTQRAEHFRELGRNWGRENNQRLNRRARSEVLDAYGRKCVCCGETNPAFLTVDHVNNDGAKHRMETFGHNASGTALTKWLRKEGFPKDGFQLLCYNCNCAKGRLGVCPHEAIRTMHETWEA